ncbi:MAG: hypothetical protein JXR33_00050 [Coriobacteriia bacterium]|nr:hypothetical protein [Coriobacteriia bacterium]
MRRAVIPLAVIVAFTVALVPATAFGAQVPTDVTAAELTSLTQDLDGAMVRLSGEVVSEALHSDGEGVWLNVLSDGTAIGVYMPAEMAEAVTTFGDYRHNGDVIEVVGVYNEACDEHGGDLDVHATELRVIEPGSPREQSVDTWKGIVGVLGLIVAFVLSRRFRRMRHEVIT